MPTVKLSEISHRYGATTVLDRLSLSLEEGEYVVLLGASGCGKTTLLRTIAGLIQAESGTVTISDVDVTRVSPRDRNVSLVPQSDGLYPHLTIARSIELAIRERLGPSERRERVHQAAATVRIDSLLERYPHQLSGGQLRRAAVAKSIARRAAVRLLDEPLTAIDSNLRFQIESDLKRLHHSAQGVTLHVTHDGREAMRLADRIAVLDAGRIVQLATPDILFRRPISPSVASAIGDSPFQTLRVTRQNGYWQSTDGRKLKGPDMEDLDAQKNATVQIGYYESDVQANERGDEDPSSRLWIDEDHAVPSNQIRWFC